MFFKWHVIPFLLFLYYKNDFIALLLKVKVFCETITTVISISSASLQKEKGFVLRYHVPVQWQCHSW